MCYLGLIDGAIERRHGEAITAWTRAKLQAPEQIQGKDLYAYLDSIYKGGGKKLGKISLQSVSSAEFHLLNLEKLLFYSS